MDIETAIVAGSAILGSKEALEKILGPTADYIGGEIQGFVQKCNINLDTIFKIYRNKAWRKIESTRTGKPKSIKAYY